MLELTCNRSIIDLEDTVCLGREGLSLNSPNFVLLLK